MTRTVRLVVIVECEVLDDAWDDQMLTDNAVDYVNSMIGEAERRYDTRWDEAAPYRLIADAALWTWDNFLLDQAEGQIEAAL